MNPNHQKILENRLQELKIDNISEKLLAFEIYFDTLTDCGRQYNLTGLKEDGDIFENLFYDSLFLQEYLNLCTGISMLPRKDFSLRRNDIVAEPVISNPPRRERNLTKNETSLMDIGTGAGFPGLPLKILNPSLRLVLVDSSAKKIDFLKKVCGELKLDNIEFLGARAEDLGRRIDYREKADIVTAKAVAAMNILLELTMPLINDTGQLIFLKGKKVFDEIKQAERALRLLGGKILKIDEKVLPISNKISYIVIISKTRTCDKKYPRPYGEIKNKPL